MAAVVANGGESLTRQVLRLDERVGHRMLPLIQTRERQGPAPYLMKTNSHGFRTHEFSREPKPGIRRVLLFGDSFSEGVGVNDGHRFSDLLEAELGNVEVLNFAVRATGTDQQYLFFREIAANLEYDLVVVGLYTGDVLRNASRYGVLTTESGDRYEKPYFELVAGKPELRNVPVPLAPKDMATLSRDESRMAYKSGLGYRLQDFVRERAPWAKPMLQRATRHQPAKYLGAPDHPAWLLTRSILDEWADEANSSLLVLGIPPHQYVEGNASATHYRDRFAELQAEQHLFVHDLLPDLVQARKDVGAKALRIAGDAHWTTKGHAVVAESMLPAVVEALASSPREVLS